jgi:hypothetical protein
MAEQPREVSITIKGPFEMDEVARLIDLIRDLDNRHPERRYEIIIDDPEVTIAEAEKTMRDDLLPPVPGRSTAFATFRKQ